MIYFREATGIVKFNSDNIEMAQVFAHVVGDIIGIQHDYSTHRGRSWTCIREGAANTKYQIMDYRSPKEMKWSRCSNTDFAYYYRKIVDTQGQFCLQ